MAMMTGADGSGDELLADINTTPLIDVMLVLLIMLIITIPLTTHSLEMALPAPGEAETPVGPPPVRLVAQDDGQWRWNETPVTDPAALEALFHALAAQPTPPEVQVIPRHATRWDTVAAILASAQRQGVTTLALAQPPDSGDHGQ
ncbi:ExbD/TolR family protein [Insolitispirillum peregrinum]|uniref:Outer membrane transport energization protein ExbD n=2 Tax=Insolitispirillum peregrinum TaxID=80876 RepID=A0A1N7NKP7_9PROT|nr:biopolymer transporter ExbD [Insolitispirillum peregrinum]SIS98983.1 outer membrane transport energization protein ExbD [Insolitispirillum peregrinum]